VAWPSQEGLAKQLQAAGFENVNYKNLIFGVVAIHTGFKAAK
jgi:ubiquinone/menaquinone biosynthesis C-methylase UbiE